jgi:hypothetical protein
MKKIFVISHQRSGTHFLINSIAVNFPGYSDKQIDVVNISDMEKALSEPQTQRIYKSHHQAAFFLPYLETISKIGHIFYIMRDGRDVMASSWRYHQKAHLENPGAFPNIASFSEWLRIDPRQWAFDKPYSIKQADSMPGRWLIHIYDWLACDSAHVFVYEELKTDFAREMVRMGNILNYDPQTFEIPSIMNSFSIHPYKGEAGRWKEVFTKEDLDYFNEKTGNLYGYSI